MLQNPIYLKEILPEHVNLNENLKEPVSLTMMLKESVNLNKVLQEPVNLTGGSARYTYRSTGL
jgi:hypothetical protein